MAGGQPFSIPSHQLQLPSSQLACGSDVWDADADDESVLLPLRQQLRVPWLGLSGASELTTWGERRGNAWGGAWPGEGPLPAPAPAAATPLPLRAARRAWGAPGPCQASGSPVLSPPATLTPLDPFMGRAGTEALGETVTSTLAGSGAMLGAGGGSGLGGTTAGGSAPWGSAAKQRGSRGELHGFLDVLAKPQPLGLGTPPGPRPRSAPGTPVRRAAQDTGERAPLAGVPHSVRVHQPKQPQQQQKPTSGAPAYLAASAGAGAGAGTGAGARAGGGVPRGSISWREGGGGQRKDLGEEGAYQEQQQQQLRTLLHPPRKLTLSALPSPEHLPTPQEWLK